MAKKTKQDDELALQRRRRRLSKTMPTPNWTDAVVYHHEHYPRELCCQCNSKWCKGRYYPRHYMAGTICYDCYLQGLKRWQLELLSPSASIVGKP